MNGPFLCSQLGAIKSEEVHIETVQWGCTLVTFIRTIII